MSKRRYLGDILTCQPSAWAFWASAHYTNSTHNTTLLNTTGTGLESPSIPYRPVQLLTARWWRYWIREETPRPRVQKVHRESSTFLVSFDQQILNTGPVLYAQSWQDSSAHYRGVEEKESSLEMRASYGWEGLWVKWKSSGEETRSSTHTRTDKHKWLRSHQSTALFLRHHLWLSLHLGRKLIVFCEPELN
jgi:hypothetical protein